MTSVKEDIFILSTEENGPVDTAGDRRKCVEPKDSDAVLGTQAHLSLSNSLSK